MWWTPETKDERRIAEILPRLATRFRAASEDELVLGVGTYITPNGLVPLLLINQWKAETLAPIAYALHRTGLPEVVSARLTAWELPDDTVFLLVTPPEPLASTTAAVAVPGAAIRHRVPGGKSATAGVSLACGACVSHPCSFLTVGHFAPAGAPVELAEKRRFGRTRYQSIGNVALCLDPRSTPGVPGYDVAIVTAPGHVQCHTPPFGGIARLQGPLRRPQLATLHSGVSGVVANVALSGTLTDYGGNGCLWKNSWLVLPSNTTVQGDSGGVVVLDPAQTVAGMIVGGSRLPSSKTYMAQYAHDMESLVNDVLNPAGYTLV